MAGDWPSSSCRSAGSRRPPSTTLMTRAPALSATWRAVDGKAIEPEPGFALMKQSDCFNCHAIETQIVGPPLLTQALAYFSSARAPVYFPGAAFLTAALLAFASALLLARVTRRHPAGAGMTVSAPAAPVDRE